MDSLIKRGKLKLVNHRERHFLQICGAHTHFQSHRVTHQLLHLSYHLTSCYAHVKPRDHGHGEPGSRELSRCERSHFFVIY